MTGRARRYQIRYDYIKFHHYRLGVHSHILARQRGPVHVLDQPRCRRGDYGMRSVRALNEAGPCIALGLILRETETCIGYRDRRGAAKFISKDCTVHTEPCLSCPDHPRTKYPEGYWDG